MLLYRDNQVHPAAVKILRRGLLPGRRRAKILAKDFVPSPIGGDRLPRAADGGEASRRAK